MINCGPQTFWRPVCSTYPEVCELLPNQWMQTTAALKIWCIPAKTRNPPKNLPCIYGLVSRSARTNRQNPTNKQTDTRENWRSNSTMNPLRFHQSTNRRKKNCFKSKQVQEQNHGEAIMTTTVVLDGNVAIGFDGNATRGNPSSTHSTTVLLDAHHSGNRSSTHSASVLLDAHHSPRKLRNRPRKLRSSRTPPWRLLDAHHGPRKLRNRPRKLRSSRTWRCRLLDAHPGPQKLRNRPQKLRSSRTPPRSVLTGLVAHRQIETDKKRLLRFHKSSQRFTEHIWRALCAHEYLSYKIKMILHLRSYTYSSSVWRILSLYILMQYPWE